MTSKPLVTGNVEELLEIMKALRDPETGCPWDVRQDFKSIARYTLEEAYEVVEAIELDDMDELRDELGDLLLQVVFHAQMASEQQLFGFCDVVRSICDKMISRHPHVFGTKADRAKVPEKGFWEDIKARERAQKPQSGAKADGLLESVPTALPALTRANKLQAKAARAGFDWPDIDGVFAKVDEELRELRLAVSQNTPEKVAEELGDVMFSVVNLSRHLDLDPETVLRDGNRKFQRRFSEMEKLSEKPLEENDAAELEQLWLMAKRQDEC